MLLIIILSGCNKEEVEERVEFSTESATSLVNKLGLGEKSSLLLEANSDGQCTKNIETYVNNRIEIENSESRHRVIRWYVISVGFVLLSFYVSWLTYRFKIEKLNLKKKR